MATKQFTPAQIRAFLDNLGLAKFDVKTGTVRFQRAYAFGKALKVDGKFGPATSDAARVSIAHGYRLSPHFHWSELQCGCRGTYGGCDRWNISRDLLVMLESLRRKGYKNGLSILSAYRCQRFNRNIGGAPNSLHMGIATAADIPQVYTPNEIKKMRVTNLNDIGYKTHSGEVCHVGYKKGRKTPVVFAEGY